MKHIYLFAALAVLSTSTAHAQPATSSTRSSLSASETVEKPSAEIIQSVASRVKPALVRIHVVSSEADDGREQRSESFGSGAIISPDGYVVTNHHVAGEAVWLSVTLANKKEVSAKLVGTDPLSDIAIIKLEARDTPYPVASWGDSSRLRVGDAVLAMGSPFALSQSVTAGIVANTELVLPNQDSEFNLDGENVGSIVRWIGHDALIQPGNSGGPLVNLSGEIIGINEVNLGLSGAIPGNLAREVAEQIIAKGRVSRSFTGLDVQPRLHSDARQNGVLIGGVWPDSPAAKAGIKAGDILISADGAPVDAEFPEQLPLVNLQLARLPLDKTSTLTLQRAGETLNVSLTPTLRERNLSQAREVRGWGITASDLTDVMAKEYMLPNTNGVVVWSLQSGAPAANAKPPLEEADVIVGVGGQKINSMSDLRAATTAIPKSEAGTPTLVDVMREGERVLLVLNLNPLPADDSSTEVAKAYFPISTQVVTPLLAQSLKLPPGTQGVRITRVHPEGAAQKAGFKVGDIITRLDTDKVEASQPEDNEVFDAMVRQYRIGTSVRVWLIRNGKAQMIPITLPRAPKQERELSVYRDENFGIALRDVTYNDRLKGDAKRDADGAKVTNVQSGSWGALAGLKQGDIITQIDGTTVKNTDQARAKLSALEKSRARDVVFFVTRGVSTLYVEAQTDWSVEDSTKIAESTAKENA